MDILGYVGERVVVTGAASGMGAAVARLLGEQGAEVHALDVQPVEAPAKQSIHCDLRDRESIDAALTRLPESLFGVFHCAGLPGPPFSNLDTMLVNFVGPRHLTAGLLPRLVRGGAISSISSVAGMGWEKNREAVEALLDTPDFDAGSDWCQAHPKQANGYLFSKQCIILETKRRAAEWVDRELRVNCISPSPTDTPMLSSFHQQVTREFLEEHFLSPLGRNATPEEQAEPLVLLGSRAARFVSGQNLYVDFGYVASVECGARKSLL